MADFQLSNPMGHMSEVSVMPIHLAEGVARLGLAPPGVRLTEPSKDQVRYRSAALAAHDKADLGSH
jgi:S-adenosylhomocysteine hydrolase